MIFSSAVLPFKPLAVAISAVLVLSACGERKEEKKPATQVAAKVNGSEISVHQINAVLSRANGITADNAEQAKKEILNKLIDQQLAYDQAVEKKLDRTPDVMMAIESAKREIVARAYLDQVIGALAKPTEDDARKYYAETPALFANRKIYRIQELTVGNDTSVLAQMKQMVAAGRSLDDMAAWLKSHQVQFGNTGTTRPAEQIPLDILPKLAELREGQIAVFEGPQNFIVVRLLGSQPAAISETEARPRILQFLHNRNAQKAIEAELQKMKAAAKIEFQGEFASTAKPVASAPAADLAKPAVPNAEKGVAGLK